MRIAHSELVAEEVALEVSGTSAHPLRLRARGPAHRAASQPSGPHRRPHQDRPESAVTVTLPRPVVRRGGVRLRSASRAVSGIHGIRMGRVTFEGVPDTDCVPVGVHGEIGIGIDRDFRV